MVKALAKWHILIIDNDPAAALVTARGLQRLLTSDIEVTIAESAQAALNLNIETPLDLLIIDPSPQLQATSALISKVRSDSPKTTILVFTGHDTPRLRKHMNGLGVQHYLNKSVNIQQLSTTVSTLLTETSDNVSLETPIARLLAQ